MNTEIKELLKAGAVNVVFTKKDGSERVMNCTLNENLVPATPTTETKERKHNDEVCPVWDLDIGAWRSFRFDSVKSYKGV